MKSHQLNTCPSEAPYGLDAHYGLTLPAFECQEQRERRRIRSIAQFFFGLGCLALASALSLHLLLGY